MPAIVQAIIVFVVMVAVLFGGAGRWDLPFFWAYVALMFGGSAASYFAMSPGLVAERVRPGPGGVDRGMRFAIIPFFLGAPLVAALDARYGWSTMPPWLSVVGLAGSGMGLALTDLAIRANPFFSPVVRIQTERGHHLVTGGPYRFVRHPGYLAGLALMLFSPLLLGSWWAFIPYGVAAAMLLHRVVIEDCYLRHNLPGYVEYAARVRYRLIPGVW